MKFSISIKDFIIQTISYLYILLFVYASVSKLLDFENFQIQLGQSPLLSAYAGVVSVLIIVAELLTAFLLTLRRTRLIGLYLSTGLMVSFTVYIYLILNYSEFVPCSCGGVLEKLGWQEHLIFNLVFVGLGISAIWIDENLRLKIKIRVISKLVLLCCVFTVGVLVLFFSSEHIIKKENPFIRRFIPHAITEEKAYDLGFNSYYFAGYHQGKIYLGNYTTPLILSIVDTTLTNEQSLKIHLDETSHQFQSIQIKVKAPYFYVYDGTVPVIYRGILNENFVQTISLGEVYFTQMEVSDSLHFLFNTKSTKTKFRVLAFLNLNHNVQVEINHELLTVQLDGVFDTDGRLIKNEGGEDFIYVYYYRNEIPVFDKNLNLTGNFQTIDTISQAQVKIKKLSNDINKMEAPPLKINDKSVLYQGILFNQSSLMGKFEPPNLWDISSIIDVYAVKGKVYLGSFFIQNRGKEKMTQMLVTDTDLFVLSGTEIVRYRLAQSIKQYFEEGEAENP